MPKLDDQTLNLVSSHHYQFSAVPPDRLGASEFTLITLVVDVSGSVSPYRDEIEACLKQVIESCHFQARSEHLLIRLSVFNSNLREHHGFKELAQINPDDYRSTLRTGGATALFDASFECFDTTAHYGRLLAQGGIAVNALAFVITDGQDNSSSRAPDQIRQLIDTIRRDETLTGFTTILVGVGGDSSTSTYLNQFHQAAGFDQYIDLGAATKANLAKLAGFMSRSINLSSMVLSGQHPGVIGF